MEMYKCSHCGKLVNANERVLVKEGKDGYYYICPSCQRCIVECDNVKNIKLGDEKSVDNYVALNEEVIAKTIENWNKNCIYLCKYPKNQEKINELLETEEFFGDSKNILFTFLKIDSESYLKKLKENPFYVRWKYKFVVAQLEQALLDVRLLWQIRKPTYEEIQIEKALEQEIIQAKAKEKNVQGSLKVQYELWLQKHPDYIEHYKRTNKMKKGEKKDTTIND